MVLRGSMISTRRVRAVGLLAALLMPLGIAVHVIWEFAGVGLQADFTQRHGYLLALLAVSVVTLFALARQSGSAHERRRALTLLLADLPNRGRGTAFAAITVCLQLGFAALTLLLEGTAVTPLASAVTLLCALIAALLGAVAINAGAAPLVALAVSLAHFCTRDRQTRCSVRVARRYANTPRFTRVLHYALFVPNRPPPNVSLISASISLGNSRRAFRFF